MSTRRFEFKDARSYKFWEIEVQGDSYTVRYGKVGTDGATSSKSFASPEKAQAEAEKKIKSKTKKGYAEVAVDADAGASPDETTDADEWAVRADQLQAAGDPWGERISVFAKWQAAKGADKRKWKKRLKELDDEHGEHFYGPKLLAVMNEDGFERAARLTWEYGYIVRARLGAPDYDYDGPDIHEVIAAVAESPASAHMRELIVGMVDFEGENEYHGTIDAFAKGRYEAMESVFIGEFEYPEDTEISWTDVGDVGKLLPAMPNLRTLRVRGGGVQMSNFDHGKLQRLEVESGGLPAEGVRGFAEGKLPELRHVSLWLGTENYGGVTDLAALEPLWSTQDMPKLQHLGLQNSEIQDQIAAALAKSAILGQVSSVDMSMGTLRGPGVQAILDNAARFEHLKSLRLAQNFISNEQGRQLVDRLGDLVTIGPQDTPYDWGEGEMHYYTTVSE